jgi:hypothetical protein
MRKRHREQFVALLVVLLTCTLTHAQEQKSDTHGELENIIRSTQNAKSSGTLFQWSLSSSATTGGPNLNEPIVTDRPDFTEASSTVGVGVAQFEMGYTYSSDDHENTTTTSHSSPELLLRYGIFQDWIELRLGGNYLNQQFGNITTSGCEDLYMGLKFGLTPQDGWLPEMALVTQMTVPTGANAYTADEVLPGMNLIYGLEINDFLRAAGSTQFNRSIDDGTGKLYTEWAQSLELGYTLTDQIGAYTEWYAFFPNNADTANQQYYLDGGFTYLINNNIQWDIRGGIGLNGASDDYLIGTGLSIRFQ